jgi:hypothetical protein
MDQAEAFAFIAFKNPLKTYGPERHKAVGFWNI